MLFIETTPYYASFLSLCFAVRRALGAYIPDKDSLRIPHDVCGAMFPLEIRLMYCSAHILLPLPC
jgi:hypothetical protein